MPIINGQGRVGVRVPAVAGGGGGGTDADAQAFITARAEYRPAHGGLQAFAVGIAFECFKDVFHMFCLGINCPCNLPFRIG